MPTEEEIRVGAEALVKSRWERLNAAIPPDLWDTIKERRSGIEALKEARAVLEAVEKYRREL